MATTNASSNVPPTMCDIWQHAKHVVVQPWLVPQSWY